MELPRARNVAQERWLLLRNALLKKSTNEVPICSIRNHNVLDVFVVNTVHSPNQTDSDREVWHKYVLIDEDRISDTPAKYFSVLLKRPMLNYCEDIQSFDNTGNVCIWASEQAMARYMIKNMLLFSDTSVIELGGGCSCLAGVMLAKYGSLRRMVLSDGNEKAVNNVHLIALHNNLKNTEVLKLQWSNSTTLSRNAGTFNYVIAADCIFKDDQRMSLIYAINILLTRNGIGIIFSPKRGTALSDFISKSKSFFGHDNVEVVEKYDDEVWRGHLRKLQCSTYNTDIHYPIFVRIRK